jgi:hypothetical protein
MKASGFGRSWVGLTISAAVLSLCLGTTALADLLGDRAQLDPLLKVLVDPLGKHGIDVVAGDTSEVKMPKSSRPRVALLSGMPTVDRGPEWRKATWMKEFEKGTAGFVAGVKSSGEGGVLRKALRPPFGKRRHSRRPGVLDQSGEGRLLDRASCRARWLRRDLRRTYRKNRSPQVSNRRPV